MIKLCAIAALGDCGLYVDRFTAESNPNVSNVSVAVRTNEFKNAVLNITFINSVTFSKIFAYFSLKIAEDQNDREYKREYIKTVIDVGKMFTDSLVNPFLRSYASTLRKFMDFELNFPLPAGTYRFTNIVFGSTFVPVLSDTKGSVSVRLVAKIPGSSTTKFMANLAFYGGLRRE